MGIFEKTTFSMLHSIRQSWWVWAIRGLLLSLFGLLAIFLPNLTLHMLMIYLGLIFLLSGLVSLYSGIRSRSYSTGWWGYVLLGSADLLLAILILNNLSAALEIFTLVIGLWALLMGLVLLYVGYRMNSAKIILYLNGLVSTAFGTIILIRPFESAKAFASLLGFFTILFGLFVIYLSFKMKPSSAKEQTGVD